MDKNILNAINPQDNSENERVLIIKKERMNLKDNLFVKRGKIFVEHHWNEFKFTVLGLIVSILFLTIGFWATLLVAILAIIGNIYGRLRDGDRRILIFFDRLFGRF